MEPFVFKLPTKIIFGSGKLAETGQEAKVLGKRPLLLTGRRAMQELGVLRRVLSMLEGVGLEPVLFERIESNPRVETLDAAVALGLEKGCDFVIGLGGGSPMDSAKGVASALKVSRPGAQVSVWDFTSAKGEARLKVESTLPILLISSTAATGSEGNCAAVINKDSTKEKAVLWDLNAFPTVSIVDPEITLGLPLQNTRDGVIDMMLHVLEQSFNGGEKAPYQDRVAEGMVRGMMEALDAVEANPKDLQARENLSWASVAALIAGGGPNFGRSGAFTVHHLEHPLSGHTDISHGHGLAALWPRYLQAILEKRSKKIAEMGINLFGVAPGSNAAEKSIAAIEVWLRRHELWFHLKDFGVDAATIPKMAADAIRLSGGGRNFLDAPLPLNQERCEAIYQAAM
jgi:alcohol dehydrogenase YqhD (iron-dependent ADH family)